MKDNNSWLKNLAHSLVKRYPLDSAEDLTTKLCSMLEEVVIDESGARSLIDAAILDFDDTEAGKAARAKASYLDKNCNDD